MLNGLLKGNSRVHLKYHFCVSHKDEEAFIKYISGHMEEQAATEFVEVFMDDADFSFMLSSEWIKNVGKIVGENVFESERLSHKKTGIVDSTKYPNAITYTESTENTPTHTTQEIVRLLVKRSIFEGWDGIKLTLDFTEFPNGDTFSSFAFHALVDKEDVETILQQTSQLNFELFPSRSKIIEYLSRYQPKIYKDLQKSNHIPKIQYKVRNGTEENSCLFTYHSNSEVHKWIGECKGKIPSLKILARNLNLTTIKLSAFLKQGRVNSDVREKFQHFMNYSVATKDVMVKIKERNEEQMKHYIDMSEVDLVSSFKERLMQCSEVRTYSICILYGYPIVEIETRSENVGRLDEIFEKDIQTGWVGIMKNDFERKFYHRSATMSKRPTSPEDAVLIARPTYDSSLLADCSKLDDSLTLVDISILSDNG